MKISELKSGQGNVNVDGIIKEIGEVRTFNKFGRELSVANAVLEDDSGSIKLTLWNDDVARFKEGEKIKIVNGYINEFQGESQLTSGKYGSIEKMGEGESVPAGESSVEPVSEPVNDSEEEEKTPKEEVF